jgi:excisionase family DNA binding protein
MHKNTAPAGYSCSYESEPLGDSLRDQWGTVTGLASKYGCHPNTIRNWIHSGKLSAARFGPRMIRVRESDLQALLKPYENGQAGQWARHSF